MAGRTAGQDCTGSDAPSDEMVVVDEEELPRLPGDDRDVPCRAGAGSGRCARHRDCTPGGRSTSRREDDHLTRAGGAGLSGARVLGERGSRGSAPRRTPSAWRVCGGPATSPTRSGARSPWRTSGSRRVVCGDALRTYERGLAACRPSRAGTVLRGRRTCTWG